MIAGAFGSQYNVICGYQSEVITFRDTNRYTMHV